ncbi:uncharacterized protein LOC119667241 [Teleopsis dalmanni]|uniref:uncharacterized protein LOC119667241 n=1 Tax=Teleopsis dalmanni TaxID=139649 RepID=UPI0018CF951D|nr:uncharacterized protein LOC119667241 [Teleopsis dalmanni]
MIELTHFIDKITKNNVPGLINVTLDSFTIGRFTSYLHDGCPDGYMQIAESARTPIGGMWCGTSWGPVLFYSETRSLIFTIKLNKLARDQSGYNFDFRIRYKVLSRDSSVTRYGGIKLEELNQWYNRSNYLNQNAIEDFTNSSGAHSDRYGQDFSLFSQYANNKTFVNSLQKLVAKDENNYTEPRYYLGDLIPGTYCSRIFSDCDKKSCRLQSPNYPGIYPRNLTCYFAVRQHDVPHGKHALILVRQPKGNLVWISTQETTANKLTPSASEKEKKFEPRLKTWNDCDYIQVGKFKCNLCDYSCIQTNSYKRHIRTNHPEVYKRIACDICNFVTITEQKLLAHKEDHKKGLIVNYEDSMDATRNNCFKNPGKLHDKTNEISVDCFLPLESVDSLPHEPPLDTGGVTIPAPTEDTQFPTYLNN